MSRSLRHKQEGFTLVELLVVIVLIVVLASMMVVAATRSDRPSRARLAIERVMASTSVVPANRPAT